MKKTTALIILITIFLFMLTACSTTPANEIIEAQPTNGDSEAQPTGSFPEAQYDNPPKMFLDYRIYGKAVRSTVVYASARWNNTYMDAWPEKAVITKAGYFNKIKITFESAPDSFEEIRIYNADGYTYAFNGAFNGLIKKAEYTLVLPNEEGSYDYMVRANWPQGQADYFFTVITDCFFTVIITP